MAKRALPEQRGLAMRIDAKGRLTIPRRIRESLGLKPGDAVYCRSQGGAIHCVRAENPFDALAEHAEQEYAAGRTVGLREYARRRDPNA